MLIFSLKKNKNNKKFHKLVSQHKTKKVKESQDEGKSRGITKFKIEICILYTSAKTILIKAKVYAAW